MTNLHQGVELGELNLALRRLFAHLFARFRPLTRLTTQELQRRDVVVLVPNFALIPIAIVVVLLMSDIKKSKTTFSALRERLRTSSKGNPRVFDVDCRREPPDMS